MPIEFIKELVLLLRSQYPLVFVLSQEENRARRYLEEAASEAGLGVLYPRIPGETFSVMSRLCSSDDKASVVVFDDVHRRLEDPDVIRSLGDIAINKQFEKRTAVIIAPWVELPLEVERLSAVITLPLPDRAALRVLLDEACADTGVMLTDEDVSVYVRTAQGMTEQEAFRAFKKAMVGWPENADLALVSIIKDKKLALRRSRVLEDVDIPTSLEEVGGLDRLKEWLVFRKEAFGERARAYGLPSPRGLLLMGVQGCGKSISAKAVAHHWQLPLVRLDLSAVFGSSRPEAALRGAMRAAEAMAPVVMWIDEIEKGFDIGGEGSVARIIGGMVTWLQEKTQEVFVVATANRVHALPPELTRKGRFDEVFFVDLPDIHERFDILSIHLRKRGRRPDDFALESLASRTERFTGSELEQLVIAALHLSFYRGEELTDADLLSAASEIVPLYETYEEEIKKLREWARKRARRASTDRRKIDLFE